MDSPAVADPATETPEVAEDGKLNLIRRSYVRKYTFEAVTRLRPEIATQITRISADFYEAADKALADWIDARVTAMGKGGKTVN